MSAMPRCIHCGFQFQGFFLPEMLGKHCPSCGELFDGHVKYTDDGEPVLLDQRDMEAIRDARAYFASVGQRSGR